MTQNYLDIAEGCRVGDQCAQMDFYRLFSRAAYNSSYRILDNREEAEEVTQEIILRALTRPELIRTDRNMMEALVRRMAINSSIDICRRRKVELVEITPRIERQESLWESQEIINAEGVSREMIIEKLAEMPKGLRVILTLHLIEGYDYEEISDILDSEPAAIRNQYSRARRRLAQLLTEEIKSR